MLLLMMWGWGDPGEIRLEGWCMGALRTALRVTRDAHEEAHVERCLWRLGWTENKDSRERLVSRCVWFTYARRPNRVFRPYPVFRTETLGIPTDVSRNDYIDRITGMGSV